MVIVICASVSVAAEPPLCDIRVDVNGCTSAPYNWNKLDLSETVPNLIDYTTGSPTAIDIQMSTLNGWDKGSGLRWTHGNLDWVDADAIAAAVARADRTPPRRPRFSRSRNDSAQSFAKGY